MASAGHGLLAQRQKIEAHLKTLINNDLKNICKAYSLAVSGTKAVLQERIIKHLRKIVSDGDQSVLNTFEYRVKHHGDSPPRDTQQSQPPPQPMGASASQQPSTMPPATQRPAASQSSRLNFKQSPFYEIQETVLKPHDLPAGPEMPQNRHSVKESLVLSEDQARRLKEDKSLRLMLYCGQNAGLNVYSAGLDVAFPNQLEVKVNGDDVKSNFKGLKNKPGSTKPADITSFVRAARGYPNQISITYALTSKRFAFMVNLVRHVPAAELTTRIQHGNVIPKHRVLEEMRRVNADPDIMSMSVKMSLKDPVSTMRITIPIRSTVCTHNQCFDGAMFMQLQEQAPTWSCPICSKSVSFEGLCVDKYFEEILEKTSKSIEQVTIEPNGEWSVVKEDQEKGMSNRAKGVARASYDDDFEDDFVEVTDAPTNGATNGLSANWQSGSTASPFAATNFPVNTPPLSSREASVAQSTVSTRQAPNKRASSAIIDLTLSDEDEPPRPAKRTHLSGNATSSYNTPASIPESRRPTYNNNATSDASNFRQQSVAQLPQLPRPNMYPSHAASQSPIQLSPYNSNPSNYAQQHPSRPPSVNGMPPFSIRPPPPQPNGGPRLAPMQPPAFGQDDYRGSNAGGWRSDTNYDRYGSSPG